MSITPKNTDPLTPIGLMHSFIRWASVIGLAGLCFHYADSWIQAVILRGAQ